MLRKVLLCFWVVLVFHWSSTSFLKVLEPSTWFNAPIYSDKVNLSDILNPKSQFFEGYAHDKNYAFLGPEFIFRKIAHATTYSLLSILLLTNLSRFKHLYKMSWIFTIFIAFLDECNQYMMVGRSGRIMDVGIDSLSALIALTFLFIYEKILVKKYAAANQIKTNPK